MLDFVGHYLQDPIYVISVAVPAGAAAWRWNNWRRQAPKEVKKIDAEQQAADAQTIESILSSVSHVTGLIGDVRTQVSEGLLHELHDLSDKIDERIDGLEDRVEKLEEGNDAASEERPADGG